MTLYSYFLPENFIGPPDYAGTLFNQFVEDHDDRMDKQENAEEKPEPEDERYIVTNMTMGKIIELLKIHLEPDDDEACEEEGILPGWTAISYACDGVGLWVEEHTALECVQAIVDQKRVSFSSDNSKRLKSTFLDYAKEHAYFGSNSQSMIVELSVLEKFKG